MYEYKANVVSVYDGDTLRVDIDLGFDVWMKNASIRLIGINAPELRGETKPAGLISRDALRTQVLGKTVILQTVRDATEKYGRYLGTVILDGININSWLVANNYAVPYMEG